MKTRHQVALTLLPMLWAIGCNLDAGNSGGAKEDTDAPAAEAKPGSCAEGGKTGHTCSDYTAEGAEAGRKYCNMTGGGTNVWSDSPCPTANLIGTCVRRRGQKQRYYSTGANAVSAAQAKQTCITVSEGKWEAASGAE